MSELIVTLIRSVIDDMNESRDEKIPTESLPQVGLYGDAGVFDSMHLVSFLVQVEEALEDEFGLEISLTSEKAVSRRVSPFASVRTLVDFIEEELQLAGGPEWQQRAAGKLASQGG